MAKTTTDSRRRRNLVLSGAPHFFKVVFSPADRGIKIPTMFMRKHGSDLKRTVRLEVPSGVAWSIELLHTDYGTWLHKGWKEFAEYYSIEQFHFLVFRYDGNSKFHVMICNTTACEIEYPIESARRGMHDRRRQGKLLRMASSVREKEEMYSDDDDDVSIDFEEETAPARGAKRGRKSKNALQIWDEDDEFVRGFQSRKRIKDESYVGTEMAAPIQSFTRALNREASLTYQRAKAFRSKYPSFIVFMYPSYVSPHHSYMSIPRAFFRNYISDTRSSWLNSELRLSGGKKAWPVKFNLISRHAKIWVGWKEFVTGNNLVVGDVCIFELVWATKTFNVTIYRTS